MYHLHTPRNFPRKAGSRRPPPTMGKLLRMKADDPWLVKGDTGSGHAAMTEGDLSADQLPVYEAVKGWALGGGAKKKQTLSLGGFAGTGKSTLVGVLGRVFREGKKRVAYAAYSGKASLVLKKKLLAAGAYVDDGLGYCGTMHRLLYTPEVNERTGEVIGWIPAESLDFDLVVIDEASMVSQELYTQLLSYGVPVLVVGDHGQLPPVNGDGFNLMQNPELRLEKIHRQALGNPILWLTDYIRTNGTLPPRSALPQDPRLSYVRPVPGWLASNLGYTCLDEAHRGVVLTGTNATRVRANATIRAHFGLPADHPVPGDFGIVLKNARFEGETWIFNGQRFRFRDVAPHRPGTPQADARLVFPEEGTVALAPICLPQIGRPGTYKSFEELETDGYPVRSWQQAGMLVDYGYVATVHKFQGSQAPHVTLLPERFGSQNDEEWARWLYTAATRAADTLTVAVNA